MAYSHATPVRHLVICLTVLSAAATGAAAKPPPLPSAEEEIHGALEDMRTAKYFSFAMLVGMAWKGVRSNVTFLMPDDEALSVASPSKDDILALLWKQSIPSALSFDELRHLPAGTEMPTINGSCTLLVSSGGGGRGTLCLSGVKVVKPDICAASPSVRCHGMDGVFNVSTVEEGGATAMSCPPAPAPNHPRRAPPAPLPPAAPSGWSERAGNGGLAFGQLLMLALVFLLS